MQYVELNFRVICEGLNQTFRDLRVFHFVQVIIGAIVLLSFPFLGVDLIGVVTCIKFGAFHK